MKISGRRIRLLSFLVMAYMIVAFSWWAILLYKENQKRFELYDAIRTEASNTSQKEKVDVIRNSSEEQMKLRKKRTNVMIFSEASVFIFFLILGWWLLYRGYNKLVVAERIKKNFLLSISHELKSPITAIRLAFESVTRFGKGNKGIEKISYQGLNETNRLNELVNNVLLSTRLEETYQPDMTETDISAFVNELIERMQTKYPEAIIECRVVPVAERVTLDIGALDIILNNLLDNAIKYSLPDSRVRLSVEVKGNKLHGSVSDNGDGIPESEKELIFDRFYRVGSESTRKTKGTGLGLFLVKRLIHWTRGRISVESEKGKGSHFSFYIPLS